MARTFLAFILKASELRIPVNQSTFRAVHLHRTFQYKLVVRAAFWAEAPVFKYFGREEALVRTLLKFGNRGSSRRAQDLEKTGGFQPVGAVDLGHLGYETAAPCIID
jgi:hypothetical protein